MVLAILMAGCTQERTETDSAIPETPPDPPKVVEHKEELSKFDDPTYTSQFAVEDVEVAPGVQLSFQVTNWVNRKPDKLMMSVYADGERTESAFLKTLVDGEKGTILFDNAMHLTEVTGYYGMIPIEDFDRLANAKSVEMQLTGAPPIEFKLTDDHLKALRELSTKIER